MSITLTEAAARRVQLLREKKGNPALHLRLSVLSGGCSGFQYKFDFEDAPPSSDDLLTEANGVGLVVDAVSAPFVDGAVVDYVDELIGASFQVKNPNASSSCGCGTSFSV